MPAFFLDSYKKEAYIRGQIVLRQGEEPENIYYICSGRVLIYRETEDGVKERVVWAKQGETVGEMEVLAGEKALIYSAGVYEDGTELIVLTKDEFLHWCAQDKDFCRQIAENLARKLSIAAKTLCKQIESDAITSLREYFADICVSQIERDGSARVPYTRAEIADTCRVSERTVNRCVHRLRQAGLISIAKGKITITKSQFLRLKAEDFNT